LFNRLRMGLMLGLMDLELLPNSNFLKTLLISLPD
jgi:hypothetical protein